MTLDFPTRPKSRVTDVAICRRYASRCGRYMVERVHWLLNGYPDYWASWHFVPIEGGPNVAWKRLGRHKSKRCAMNACLRHAKRSLLVAKTIRDTRRSLLVATTN